PRRLPPGWRRRWRARKSLQGTGASFHPPHAARAARGSVVRGPACRSATDVPLHVHPAHSHPPDLTGTAYSRFTDRSMQRSLLIGVIVVVLIERARMRPGGERHTQNTHQAVRKASRKREAFYMWERGASTQQAIEQTTAQLPEAT